MYVLVPLKVYSTMWLSLLKAVLNYNNINYFISSVCTLSIFSYSKNLIPRSHILLRASLLRWRLISSLLPFCPNSICRFHSCGSAVCFSVVWTTVESDIDCYCWLQSNTDEMHVHDASWQLNLRSVIFNYSRSSQNRHILDQFLFRTARNLP